MLSGANERSNEEAIPTFISWVRVKTVIIASLTALWVICVVSCALSTDFALTVEPPPSLPFEFRIFSTRLDNFASRRLPTTFTWGQYNIEVYVGHRPRPMLTPVHDYASLSAGGRTIDALTSATYSPTGAKSLISWLGRRNSPELALTDGLEAGECWAFDGDAGQLGIQLTHPIHVSHLTVGHENKSPTSSAPKNLILWGLTPADSKFCITSGGVGDVGMPTPDFGSGYCGIHLLSGIYEPSDSMLYQNFSTINHGHCFDRVIVQVVGNWGNNVDFTCVYRIQIYGTL